MAVDQRDNPVTDLARLILEAERDRKYGSVAIKVTLIDGEVIGWEEICRNKKKTPKQGRKRS